MVTVGIVDYRAGNIRSIENALDHLGVRFVAATSPDQFGKLTHIILPGVGAFGYCAQKLQASGMQEALEDWALVQGKPMLGICVGMQLLADVGLEMGEQAGLGWIGGEVTRITTDDPSVRVPHVGWNEVVFDLPFGEIAAGTAADFYFDHSYAFHNPHRGETIATCVHGVPFVAIARRGNLIAAQFHPEKSQTAGLRFLQNFLDLKG